MKIGKLLAATAACITLGASVAARADPVTTDQWYTFGFGATGSALVDCPTCTLGVASVFAPAVPWTITLAAPMVLFVTDGFLQGDEFELFDFGTSIGTTSAAANDANHGCNNDEEACLADPLMSHGAFLLAAGNHSLTGTVTDSPFGNGAAFFIIRAAAVPEPASLALIGVALAGLGFSRRKRR